MEPDHDERRTFRRVEGDGLVVEWRVPTQGLLGRRRGEQVFQAHVLDVSVSGASFMTERVGSIRPGAVVTICYRGAAGTVEVRWIRDLGSSKAVYGVEFCVLEPQLREYLGQPVAERRGMPLPQDQWAVARALLPKFI